MAQRGRILSPLQKVFLAAVVLVLALGIWNRLRPMELQTALDTLTDGDPDHADRVRATRIVLEEGLSRGDRRGLTLAAMAAVALNDRDALKAAAGRLGLPAPERILPVEGRSTSEMALGEPVLEQLLEAMIAEETGGGDEARVLYGRVLAAAELWNMPLAASLARSGLDRVR